jgi:two-component system, cell cycle sensor histidine kinase and response regulator CckA
MEASADFRRVFEASAEPQLLLAGGAVVISVTDGYLRAAGVSRAQVVGQPLFQIPPYARCDEATKRVLQDELDKVWRSGVLFPHPARGGAAPSLSVPVLDDGGSVQQIVHTLRPLARPSEASESDSERRLRKLVEYTYDGIVLLDQTGKPFYASPSIERVRGFTVDELMTRSLIDLVHPEDLPRFGQAVQELLGQPGGVMVIQYRARHRDGHWQVLETAAVNRLDDPDVLAIVATTRDVSERVTLQDELRTRNEELQVVLTAAKAIGWDRDMLNEQPTRYSTDPAVFFCPSPEERASFDRAQIVHPDDLPAIEAAIHRAAETGDDLVLEFRGWPRASETRHYASHGRVFCDKSGRPARLVGVTWDVTERHRIHEERAQLKDRIQEGQKLESLGILAGGIAHDFNNILTTILGNASLTRLVLSETSPALDHIGQIEEASRRATDLCRQMLAYAGKGRFVLQRTSLNQLIEDTTQLLQVSISKKALLRFHLDRNLPPIVADSTQIRQVLMNLVINASDAIGERSGVISITTGMVRADRQYLDRAFQAPDIPTGDYVFMEVSDTGSGMSPEVQARIFEPFFTSKFTGRGLGLAAVSGIVHGHKGALKVYSEPGKGSSFKFLLPIAGREADIVADSNRHSHPPLRAEGTILVVDDEETVQSVASRMLESLGFRVLVASDGRHALSVYAEHKDAIVGVLMDLTMPRLDGEETFRELRRIEPQVRVLLMSGYNEQDAIARFVGKGLAGFIQKPFSIEDLKANLRSILG